MRNVLFVCTGNTCRSPMAEAWMRQLCERNAVSGWRIASAGLCACPGEEASPHAKEVLRLAGGDLSAHRARKFDPAMASEADLIVVMTRSHRRQLLETAPEAAEKCVLLMHYSKLHPDEDVPDPFGGSAHDYQSCFQTMREAIENLLFSQP